MAIELTFDKAEVKQLIDGKFEVVLTVPKSYDEKIDDFKAAFKEGQAWDVSLKKHRNKRSLNANNYCWSLLRAISRCLAETTPGGKTPPPEEIYRHHVKELGIYEPLPIKEKAIPKFKEAWEKNGIAWFVEVVDDSKLPGYKRIHAYYGSSSYDTKEMSMLIDNIVQDAKALGIETLPPQDLARLKEEWKK